MYPGTGKPVAVKQSAGPDEFVSEVGSVLGI
jgi:hypothetical protein